jgi:hypothetical protein
MAAARPGKSFRTTFTWLKQIVSDCASILNTSGQKGLGLGLLGLGVGLGLALGLHGKGVRVRVRVRVGVRVRVRVRVTWKRG